MKNLSRVLGTAATLLIGALLAQGALAASVDQISRTTAGNGRIVGLWDVEVVIEDCNSGEAQGSFIALHKFEQGGTGQVVPATSPTGLSAHMMIWSHLTGRTYAMAVKFFRFNSDGNLIGWVILRNQVTLNKAANEYVGEGVAEFYDADGNFQFMSCPSLMATRFTSE